MAIIYHIITPESHEQQLLNDSIDAPSLYTEGFIHCSKKEQISGVLERYYQNVGELFLLHIDTEKLTSELKYEVSTGGELYPHIFGKINKTAIVATECLKNARQ